MTSPFRHAVRSRDGTEIACARFGSGGAAPLVVAHGGFFDMDDWFAAAAALASGRRVHLYHRRGHGGSGDRPEAYSLDREADDLAAVVAEAGAGCVVLGHSFGATVALAYALRDGFRGRLVVYEGASAPYGTPEALERMERLVGEGRFDDALVDLFVNTSGYDPAAIAALRGTPLWTKVVPLTPLFPRQWRAINALAPSDAALVALGERCRVDLPLGSETQREPYLRDMTLLAGRIPGAAVVPFPGLDHIAPLVAPGLLAAHLDRLLGAS